MVSFRDIKAANALLDSKTAPRVAVFAGATSGVGKATVRALIATKTTVKIYLIGRKTSEDLTKAFIREMHDLNSKAEIVWLEGEVSLLSETKKLCELIKSKESSIDLLFLTAGYAPFSGRKETPEGLEIAGSLEYYSRMLFVYRLLDLLNASKRSRVISVLAGGKEQATIDLGDLELKRPGNFGGFRAQVHYATMNTTMLDKLAAANPGVTFIHSFPGWVNTGNNLRGQTPGSAWLSRTVFQPLISPFCIGIEESGQRYLFQCTSSAFGGRGTAWNGESNLNAGGNQRAGLFLVDDKCDEKQREDVLTALRKNAQDVIAEHTEMVLGRYL